MNILMKPDHSPTGNSYASVTSLYLITVPAERQWWRSHRAPPRKRTTARRRDRSPPQAQQPHLATYDTRWRTRSS